MKKTFLFFLMIVFIISLFNVFGYQTGCQKHPCYDDDGPCGECPTCCGCGCDCTTCGGEPPCNPSCSGKECGSDGCTGSCGTCEGEPYTIGCSSGACMFEKAVLKANVNTPCLDETAASKRFMLSGRSEFCGDVKVKFPWNSDYVAVDNEHTYKNYSYSKIFNLPEAYWYPTQPIEIEVVGNRQQKKSAKDELDYTNKCKDTVLLEVNYLNFYYCPDAEDTTIAGDGRFDYYDDQAHYIFNTVSYTRWEPDCVSNMQILSCSPEPTDCVNLAKKANSQNMEVIGARWRANGHSLGAYEFDGNSYIKYTGSSGSFNRGDKFSLAAWYKGSDPGTVISKINANNDYNGYELYIGTGGKLNARLSNTWSSNAIAIRGGTDFLDNQWHHLAMTYDGSSTNAGLKIFVDGKLETMSSDATGLSSAITNSVPLLIGARAKGAAGVENNIKGMIDEVKIWDYELTPAQICAQAGKELNSGVCA